MNDTNRRGFLSGFGALLASLPIVGALFGKAEASESEADFQKRRVAGWEEEARRNAENSDYWRKRAIRWIPVEERLPKLTHEADAGFQIYRCSGNVLVTDGNAVRTGQYSVWHPTDGSESRSRFTSVRGDIDATHWAELPSPPTNRNGKA